jgi:hypothetical protein
MLRGSRPGGGEAAIWLPTLPEREGVAVNYTRLYWIDRAAGLQVRRRRRTQIRRAATASRCPS